MVALTRTRSTEPKREVAFHREEGRRPPEIFRRVRLIRIISFMRDHDWIEQHIACRQIDFRSRDGRKQRL